MKIPWSKDVGILWVLGKVTFTQWWRGYSAHRSTVMLS